MYSDNSAVGLEVIYPAGQKLFISLPGNVMKGLGQQLQEFSGQHPEALSWEPVSVASEANPRGKLSQGVSTTTQPGTLPASIASCALAISVSG